MNYRFDVSKATYIIITYSEKGYYVSYYDSEDWIGEDEAHGNSHWGYHERVPLDDPTCLPLEIIREYANDKGIELSKELGIPYQIEYVPEDDDDYEN